MLWNFSAERDGRKGAALDETENMIVWRMNIGKLERVSLREIWKDEARDFTPWLEENVGILNDSLDLSLSVIEREKSVGTFAVDLLAEDDEGNKVIIECQLEKTDHDHLGKVLTYLPLFDAIEPFALQYL